MKEYKIIIDDEMDRMWQTSLDYPTNPELMRHVLKQLRGVAIETKARPRQGRKRASPPPVTSDIEL